MASRGRGFRGSGLSNNQLPPAFDQYAFIVVIGVAVATIAKASATVGQEWPSNL